MAITTVDVFGDSLAQGTLYSPAQIEGGLGSWPELVAQYLGSIPGLGPLISSGARFVNLAAPNPFPSGEWTYSGSWTQVVSTDAHDRLPYGYGKTGNGATAILTYAPNPVGSSYPPIVGFDYWWVDLAGGGNPSYSLDGGSSWTNFAETIAGSNGLKKCYIASAISQANGFKVRCANAAGTGALAFPAGITPYFVNPTTATTGVVLNNFASNGEQLHHLVQATSGDRMAVIDAVTLGTGSPISSRPTLTLVLHINDIALASASGWGTDLTALNARAAPVGTMAFLNAWAVETVDYNNTQQIAYRAQTKTTAAGLSPVVQVLDFFDAWVALGFADNAAQGTTAGFLQDLLHPSQRGHLDISRRVYWFFRNSLSTTIGGNTSAFTIGSSKLGGSDQLGGTPHVDQSPAFSGIGPNNALGSLTLQQAFSFSGIAPSDAVGALQVNTTATLTGIATTNAVGTLEVDQAFSVSGIGVTAALGSLTFALGAVSISLTGIAPTNAVGAFGELDQTAPLTGLASTIALGALTAAPGNVDVALTGIAPTSDLGTLNPVAATPVDFVGIAPTSGLGSPTFAVGAVTVALSGISTTAAVDALKPLPGAVVATLVSIDPTNAVGALTPAPGPITTSLAGIGPTNALGAISPITSGIASFAGIASSLVLGVLTTSTATLIVFSGILPTSAVGALTPTGPLPQFVPLVGIGSTMQVGHIILGGSPRVALLIAMPDWSARVAAVADMACTVEAS